MSERKAFLEKIHIKNFLSLRNVTLPFKPLTVLVGPNASGKTNTFSALQLLNRILVSESLPSDGLFVDSLWVDGTQKISFHLHTKVEENQNIYYLEINPQPEFFYLLEQLSVNGVNVISIKEGKGVVRDENGENETIYNSNKLALGSAGNYGNKPITRVFTEFIKDWKFYDFDVFLIRQECFRTFSSVTLENQEFPKLTAYGLNLIEVLWNWYKDSPDNFQNVSDSLTVSANRQIDYRHIDGRYHLFLFEDDNNSIPFAGASDGILRLVAYNILLNEPELPPLIAIEEPERNLHPGALKDIANVLEKLAERTQVIITTHSSQLLDAFSPDTLSDSLGVLLLRNRSGLGTEVLNLEEIKGKREALDGWIADFGIGSAIFDSELLQDLMEEPV